MKRLTRGLPLLLLAVAVVATYWRWGDQLSLARLADREAELRGAIADNPLTSFVTAFVLYAVVTALALPVASGLSLAYGWLFGFWQSLLLVSFASTLGATGSFLLSRYVFGDAVQRRFGERLATFNAALDREGPWFLFTLRLIPYVPFFVINLVMGLTRMRVVTFWWVSQLGMLPGTCVYLFAASSVKSLAELQRDGLGSIVTPQLAVALSLLGILPLALRAVVRRSAANARPPESQD